MEVTRWKTPETCLQTVTFSGLETGISLHVRIVRRRCTPRDSRHFSHISQTTTHECVVVSVVVAAAPRRHLGTLDLFVLDLCRDAADRRGHDTARDLDAGSPELLHERCDVGLGEAARRETVHHAGDDRRVELNFAAGAPVLADTVRVQEKLRGLIS